MKTALIAFGTRPEAIKMAPVVREARNSKIIRPVLCATAQHRQLLDQEFETLGLKPDYDLDLMRPNQSLSEITTHCLDKIGPVLEGVKPDVVLVQGDTTTAFAVALASFYRKIPIGHVEAGLRTWDKYAPFPEEKNRCMISTLADYHFAPTSQSVKNLKAEGVSARNIFLTGNTIVDSLMWMDSQRSFKNPIDVSDWGGKVVLLTAHRRENFGKPLEGIFSAIQNFAKTHPDFHIVYPVHPNPNVKGPAHSLLSEIPNIHLLNPITYLELVSLLKRCQFVVTDSGGIQEEAPTFGKPVLVLRDNTERPEGIEAGCARLVGTDPAKILEGMKLLANKNSDLYFSMTRTKNPYGNGTAATQIIKTLERKLEPTPLRLAA